MDESVPFLHRSGYFRRYGMKMWIIITTTLLRTLKGIAMKVKRRQFGEAPFICSVSHVAYSLHFSLTHHTHLSRRPRMFLLHLNL